MKHLFKIRREIIDEKIYDSLYFTHCGYCGKRIIVDIHLKYERYKIEGYLTCNECVDENPPARNGIDEAIFTDISKYLWKQ